MDMMDNIPVVHIPTALQLFLINLMVDISCLVALDFLSFAFKPPNLAFSKATQKPLLTPH